MSSQLTPLAFPWKSIWTLVGSDSVKHFIWWACNNILPARANLVRRKIIVQDICLVCVSSPKTLIHTLWEFLWAFDIRGEPCSPVKKWPTQFPDFPTLWIQMVSTLPPKELVISALILRNIWFCRNELCFQNVFEDPSRLISKAIDFYEFYHQIQSESNVRNQTSLSIVGPQHWICPLKNRL